MPAVTGPFVVGCATCERTLMVVPRIGEAEIAAIARHLRGCSPAEPLADPPATEDVLRRVRVGSIAAGADDRSRGKC